MFNLEKKSEINFKGDGVSMRLEFSRLPVGDDCGLEIDKINGKIIDFVTGVIHEFSFEITEFELLSDTVNIECEGFFNQYIGDFEIDYVLSVAGIEILNTTSKDAVLALNCAINDFSIDKQI